MNRIIPRLLILAFALFSTPGHASQPQALFDGHSLKGWAIQNNGQFSVRDGVIAVNKGTGWLRSDETFGDFVLVLEFRFLEKGANSGIFVRTGPTSKNDDKGWPDNGYQIQCMDITEGDRPLGTLIPYGAPPCKFRNDIEAVKRAYHPTKEWNTFEITCRGETLNVKLNGIEVTTVTEVKNLSGHVGIQGELGLLEFRKIEITPLTVTSQAAEGGGSAIDNEGFAPLFNGTNWDGWHLKIKSGDAELAKRVYAIEDGIVHVFKDFPDGYELNTGSNTTHGLFYTNKKYSKFIFKFDYKWGRKKFNNFDQFQYDAGCYYHVVNDKIWPVGIEYQVRYNHLKNKNHTGDFWANGLEWYCGTNDTFLLPQDGGKVKLGKKGEHAALPSAKFHALDDQWNECEVIVMADQYAIHKLNGQVVNMATKLPYGEGLIGLQSETGEIYYRNIRIKEFGEVVPMETFLK